MSVIERLYAVLCPLHVEGPYGDFDNIMPPVPDALTWRPKADPRRWQSTDLTRIRQAGAAFSIQQMWRRMQRQMMRAITMKTREMGWIHGLTESST